MLDLNISELCLLNRERVLNIENSVRKLGVRVVYSFTWGCRVCDIDPRVLDSIIENVCKNLKSSVDLNNLRSNSIIRAYRDFYWRLGIDPTKTRPAGEAVVRRILRNDFPRVNPVVDAGNLASAETLVSIGLYDVSKMIFPCRLTMSRGGELFKPIGGGLKKLEPGLPILIDSRETVLHIYPHRDSVYTSITSETTSVWVVAALVPGVFVEAGVRAIYRVLEYTSLFKWSSCGEVYIVN